MHLRTKLATTRKGDMSVVVYFAKMRGYVDEMAAAGKKLDDDDIITYILSGLDSNYNSFIENVSSKADPVSLSDVYAQLLSTEGALTPSRVTNRCR